jgi:hypothetical protein
MSTRIPSSLSFPFIPLSDSSLLPDVTGLEIGNDQRLRDTFTSSLANDEFDFSVNNKIFIGMYSYTDLATPEYLLSFAEVLYNKFLERNGKNVTDEMKPLLRFAAIIRSVKTLEDDVVCNRDFLKFLPNRLFPDRDTSLKKMLAMEELFLAGINFDIELILQGKRLDLEEEAYVQTFCCDIFFKEEEIKQLIDQALNELVNFLPDVTEKPQRMQSLLATVNCIYNRFAEQNKSIIQDNMHSLLKLTALNLSLIRQLHQENLPKELFLAHLLSAEEEEKGCHLALNSKYLQDLKKHPLATVKDIYVQAMQATCDVTVESCRNSTEKNAKTKARHIKRLLDQFQFQALTQANNAQLQELYQNNRDNLENLVNQLYIQAAEDINCAASYFNYKSEIHPINSPSIQFSYLYKKKLEVMQSLFL